MVQIVNEDRVAGGAERVAPRLSERCFQQQVITLARLYGWRVVHHWTSLHSAAGFPDLVLCRPPRLVLAELKTETGRLTTAQSCWLAELKACPAVEVYVWRPADWERIVQLLRAET